MIPVLRSHHGEYRVGECILHNCVRWNCLPQKGHLAHPRFSACRQPVDVRSRRKPLRMKTRRMPALRFYAVHKHGHRPSGHIVHGKAHMARLRKRVVDGRLRIERIRVVAHER